MVCLGVFSFKMFLLEAFYLETVLEYHLSSAF